MREFKSSVPLYTLKESGVSYLKKNIKSSTSAADVGRQYFGDEINIFESFYIAMLNNRRNTIGHAKIGSGGITGVMVDLRLITKYTVEAMAVSIILFHNHPSGTLKPSQADKNITNKIKAAMDTLDVKVLDHLIITEDSYFSFADENEL